MDVQRKSVSVTTTQTSSLAPPPPPVADDDAMSLEQLTTSAPVDTLVKSSSSLGQARGTSGVSRESIAGAARGDVGPGVSSLQGQLNALHVQPPLKLDGDFGPRTEAALKQFQVAHNLPVTGVVDDATRAAIDEGMRTGTSALPAPRAPAAVVPKHQLDANGTVDGVPVMDQNKLPRTQLGESKDATMSGQGCVLTAFAMVASKLKGEVQDPVALNDAFREQGAFERGSGRLKVGDAAQSLGLKADSVKIHDPGALSALDASLRSGEPVMVRVDYKGDADGDHTIVLTRRNPDGSYSGIDPAGGGSVTMRADVNGNLVGDGWRHYSATALTFVSKPDDFGLG
jgi:peptidoglycan hydrolase-like protein with peptidoglycan-binding domain